MRPLNGKFVFLDPIGKRWSRTRFIALLAAVAVFIGALLFVRSLLIIPRLTPPAALQNFDTRLKVIENQSDRGVPESKPLWMRFSRSLFKPPQTSSPLADAPVRLAFTVSWDPGSYRSFEQHAAQFTHVCPEWFSLVDGLGTIRSKPDLDIKRMAAGRGVALMPLLRNLTGDDWQPEAVESLADGPDERRERFMQSLIKKLQEAEAAGLVVEWGHLDPAYEPQVTALLQFMAQVLHAKGMQIWLCVPMGLELKVFDLENLAPYMDRFIAMLHDETGEDDPPGPLASQAWYEGWMDTVTAYGQPHQWVAGIGVYGYDWMDGEKQAETLGFSDVMSRAGRSGLRQCLFQQPSANPRFVYEEAGKTHTVWFLDAATFLNQLRAAQRKALGGFALSRMGTEDPGIWEAIRLAQQPVLQTADLEGLGVIRTDAEATHIGRGEFLTIEEGQADGMRRMRLDLDGRVTAQYETFPLYLTVCHQGQGARDMVTLSFDDGPDPRWTPLILDILKARGVKAAFFMVGKKVDENPDILRRIYAEGHEIGVHTYTHPNLAEVSDERVRLELNATQWLIEKITGHSTLLFRPPYKADTRPESPEEILPIQAAQELGYITVTNAIDSEDWTRPGVAGILRAVKKARNDGSIILLHDAGGDRRQTVAALPLILDWLYERGDRVVPLSTLLELPPEQLMPAQLQIEQGMARMVAHRGFDVLHAAEELIWAFAIVATLMVVLRTTVIAVLAAEHRRKPRGAAALSATSFYPPVSVILPAFNEAKVIGRTLDALLASEYSGPLEVLVVDDGSSDYTAAIVAQIANRDNRLRLIQQPNQGKAAALRTGLAAARQEIIITLDADTQFAPQAIGCLAAHFQDERVAAVSGHVKVGNLRTFIARCQELEYICGFNLDRRAYHQLNCITVVPGAISALRRSAVVAAGGISDDTLAEDTDLTLSFHRLGWRINYEANARAWTEAPETVRSLLRQRFRWAFGTLQCLWKHRDLLFQPRRGALGFFSLPGVWFYQILLVAMVPLVDSLLILSLLFGGGSAVWIYFAVFLMMDLALAFLACALDGEPLIRAWVCLPMRLLFRPLLGWVIWKSIFKAIKGAWVGWGKLERTASVGALTREQRP
jgi:peptidoglycan-N-acetylglucosamine deacetylase